MLLERDGESAAISAALRAAAASGHGAVLVFEGPAGIGKSALLAAAARAAAAGGAAVFASSASALERELAYGVVRQLLEARARQAPEVFAGAASLAASAVLSEAGPGPLAARRRAPVLHSLYWLTANIAGDTPTLLAVDDAQWCDAASARYLAYLARRLDGLPIVMVVAVRSGELEDPALAELRAAAGPRRLAPLSADAARELVRARLGGEPDAAFVAACHQAAGGVAFLLSQLLLRLAEDGVAPTAAHAAAVTQTSSQTVGRATLARLAALGPNAASVARQVAVLGRHASVSRVATLARLSAADVLRCRDTLCGAHIMRGGQPLEFAHPLVRASIYDALPTGERSLAHAEAAALLVAEGASADDVATHVLATEPGTSPDGVSVLRSAAQLALRRGAPQSAIAYLRRCAAETSSAQVLHELGGAESLARDRQAPAHLRAALALCADPLARARIVLDLLSGELIAGRWDDVLAETERALADLGPREPELAARLELFRAGLMSSDPAWVADFERDRPRLAALAAGPGAAAQPLASLLAGHAVSRVEHVAQVRPLADRALAGDGLLGGADAAAWGPQAVTALAYLGELDRAGAAVEVLRAASLTRGSTYGFALACALRAQVLALRGDLRAVEAELRACFELIDDEERQLGAPTLLHWSLDALLERPDLGDIADAAERLRLNARLAGALPGALLLDVRGRLRLRAGRRDAARADLAGCAEIMTALGSDSPDVCAWRSSLALCVDDDERAQTLLAEELALGRALGRARPQAVTLRAMAQLADADRRLGLLRESVQLLAGEPLERARSLAALGAALRRGGQRAAADEPLREALSLCDQCGAERLAVRVEGELRAIGARPRRRARTGVDALTPSEARVAARAASGLSNREIAQELFVTAKTVENQLGRVYAKLAISGRDQLAQALDAQL